MRFALPLLLVASSWLAACAVKPLQFDACSRNSVLSKNDAGALRAIGSECIDNDDVYALAKAKLNGLSLPSPRQFSLQAAVPPAESERVRFEVDVFFYFLEAYPPDIAFEKLNDLISAFDTSYHIESVQVVGSQDSLEREMSAFQVAHKRAEVIKRYLLAGGLSNNTKVDIRVRNAKQPDTPEGRARDRVVEVSVWALRRRSVAK